MSFDLLAALKQAPDIFGLVSKTWRFFARRRDRKNLEKAITALRRIHFGKEGYLPLLQKARRGPLQREEIDHINHTLQANFADIDEAVSILAEYAESTHNDWNTMENAKAIAAGKKAFLDFLRHFVDSPEPPEQDDVDLVLMSISAFNRRVERLHDRIVAELMLISERS